jgi:RNA polymerase sigma-70 factor (ECF subfamily)
MMAQTALNSHSGSPPRSGVRTADSSFVSGEVSPFESIYNQYFDFVWSSVRRLGVSPAATDDVVQEVFIVIHSRLHTLEQPQALRSWIYGIVRRTVSGHHRSRRVKEASGAALAAEPNAQPLPPTPFDLVAQNDKVKLLFTLLEDLDEPKREVFTMAELDELTVPEIAEILEIPLNTAYSRLRAARQAFEEALVRHSARRERGGGR